MKQKMRIVFVLLCMVFLTGCSRANLTSAKDNQKNSSDNETTTASPESVSEVDASEMFTDRDKEIGYDEENSIKVTLADNESVSTSNSVLVDGNTITITKEGTYILSGSLSDGMVIVAVDDTDKVRLVLNGVDITSKESAAIYVRSADKVFITTAADSRNQLTNGGTYTAIDDNNIDGVIFSKDDLTLNGAGTLTIQGNEGHGIVSKDDLVLTSGIYDITAKKHGLSGKDSVRIAEGTYHIVSGKDGIHASNDDDSTLGFIYIAGGTMEIAADDDGMHADAALTITGGSIHVTESYEGLEGLSIDITGGEINIAASDDGLNAAGGNDSSGFGKGGGDMFATEEGAYIHIAGGSLHVNAYGDGLDSNGDLFVSGGTTYVSGPVNGGNGALDYNGEGQITGGIFIAAGSFDMAQNFGTSSTQGAMLVSFDSQTAGSTISLADSNDKELISWNADKEYSCVVISCPEITEGNSYTLTAGSCTQEITMDSLIYGNGGMGGHLGGGKQDRRGPMNEQSEDWMPNQDGQMNGRPGNRMQNQDDQMDGRPGDIAPNQDSQMDGDSSEEQNSL
ncbi:MAG: carbohydrate-binding domain-containing protein [Lachnospiraceae bacterium]